VTGHRDMMTAARIFRGHVELTHSLIEESIAQAYLGGNWIGGLASLSAGRSVAVLCRTWAGRGSVRAVGVCLVVGRDRLLWDAAVAAGFEAGAERPVPDFLCAGLPA